MRFSVRKGTVVVPPPPNKPRFVWPPIAQPSDTEGSVRREQVDDIKVVREGLDVFDDWWLSAGPLTLYIIWGFLDAFIQNYVSVQR